MSAAVLQQHGVQMHQPPPKPDPDEGSFLGGSYEGFFWGDSPLSGPPKVPAQLQPTPGNSILTPTELNRTNNFLSLDNNNLMASDLSQANEGFGGEGFGPTMPMEFLMGYSTSFGTAGQHKDSLSLFPRQDSHKDNLDLFPQTWITAATVAPDNLNLHTLAGPQDGSSDQRQPATLPQDYGHHAMQSLSDLQHYSSQVHSSSGPGPSPPFPNQMNHSQGDNPSRSGFAMREPSTTMPGGFIASHAAYMDRSSMPRAHTFADPVVKDAGIGNYLAPTPESMYPQGHGMPSPTTPSSPGERQGAEALQNLGSHSRGRSYSMNKTQEWKNRSVLDNRGRHTKAFQLSPDHDHTQYTSNQQPFGYTAQPAEHISRQQQTARPELSFGSDQRFNPGAGAFVPDKQEETLDHIVQKQQNCMSAVEFSNSGMTTRVPSPIMTARPVLRTATKAGPKTTRNVEEEPQSAASSRSMKRKSIVSVREPTDPPNGSPSADGDNEDRPKKRSRAGAGHKKENLTDKQKRDNHILSERKRRGVIDTGYKNLVAVVPTIKDAVSKAGTLSMAHDFYVDLVKDNMKLKELIQQHQQA